MTIAAGCLAGIAGLTAQTAFSLRDAPSGRIAWVLVGAVFAIAAIAAGSLAVTRGARRAISQG